MTRNLVTALALALTAAISALALRPGSARLAAPPPLSLRLGALVQRELPDGSWQVVPASGEAGPSRRGDALQLTVQPEQGGQLLVAVLSGRALQVLYPLPGQTGEVRAGWAYALPDPNRSYALDGRATRLLVLLSRDPLPSSTEERQAVLHAAARRPAAPGGATLVRLELRDGTPVEVPVRRYLGASPLVATIDL